MRILVPLKLVPDPDHANKIRLSDDNQRFDFPSIAQKANPFDEYALEAALRLTEDGRAPRVRRGETIVASLGPIETEVMLRAGLATGADRAYRITANDDELDAGRVAHVLARLAKMESCDLVLMGKQSVDGDSNEVGQRLSVQLGWPQATFASRIAARDCNRLEVEREIDGGVQRLLVTLPAVITVDLRIVTPNAVRSSLTDKEFQYASGVRFAPLPAIMQSRRKPMSVLTLDDFSPLPRRSVRYTRYELPSTKAGGRVVSTANELVRLLAREAKVL